MSEESGAAGVSDVSVAGGVGVVPDGVEAVGDEAAGVEDEDVCPAGLTLV
ncbi:MAG: hypothetical protein WB536_06460 [Terriglobales bacterium]